MVEKAGTSLIIFTHDVHPHSVRSYHTSYEHSIPNLHPNVFNPTPLSLSHGSYTTLLNPHKALPANAAPSRPAVARPAT